MITIGQHLSSKSIIWHVSGVHPAPIPERILIIRRCRLTVLIVNCQERFHKNWRGGLLFKILKYNQYNKKIKQKLKLSIARR